MQPLSVLASRLMVLLRAHWPWLVRGPNLTSRDAGREGEPLLRAHWPWLVTWSQPHLEGCRA